MPLLFNAQTGQLEEAEIQPGYEQPLVSPDGKLGSAPAESYNALIEQGFRPADEQELAAKLEEQRLTSPGQQAAAFAEGAARVATFGLSTAVETALGVDPEEIRAREEANPFAAGAGEVTGAIGSALTGVGAGAAATRAGAAVATRLGLGAGLKASSSVARRMGAQAIAQSVEGALLQTGNEVHKMLVQDPGQTVQTAISNVGLANALGGGIGGLGTGALALGGLAGKKIAGLMSGIKGRAQAQAGIEAIEKQLKEAGIELPPSAKAAAVGEETVPAAQALKRSGSRAAKQFQEELVQGEESIVDSVLRAAGRERRELGELGEFSKFESGESIKKALRQEIEDVIGPVSKQFDDIQERFKTVSLNEAEKASVLSKIDELAVQEGYALSPSSPAMREIKRIRKELPGLNTLDDLRKYQSVARENLNAADQFRLSKQVLGVMREAEERSLAEAVGQQAPELLDTLNQARSGYHQSMDLIDDLNQRLRVGKYFGPKSFLNKLDDLQAERVFDRLGTVRDAEVAQLLRDRLPGTGELVRRGQQDRLLRSAVMSPKAREGSMDLRKFFAEYDKLSPEMRQAIAREGEQEVIDTARAVYQNMGQAVRTGPAPSPGLESLSSSGLLFAVLTGDISLGFALPVLGRLIGKEAPDALKLATLRALGSSAEGVNVTALAQSAKMMHNVIQGNKRLNRAIGGLLSPTVLEVVGERELPNPAQRQFIDRMLQKVGQADPLELSETITASMGEYSEPESAAMAAQTMRMVNYLEAVRPKSVKTGPLDPQAPISELEELQWQRTLNTAQQPMIVLQHIKDGTITMRDVQDINAMYPELANSMRTRMMDRVIEASTTGKDIPYRVVMGMSLFMGQSLEASLKAQNILSNQQLVTAPMEQQAPRPSRSQDLALDKLSGGAASHSQALEARKRSQ